MRHIYLASFAFLATFLSGSSSVVSAQSWPYCDSPIFCPGDILKTVELARIYPDSKTFVDKPTKNPLGQVLDSFKQLGDSPSSDSIKAWVDANFNDENHELIQAALPDFKEHVAFLDIIKDPELRGFGQAVHSYWPSLTRAVNQTALCDGCVSSLIPVNRTFVVPGGRFREFYYWDTYFILEGLLLSELYDTAKNIILNFLDIVDEFGFMPNGARIYYLNRSQPPLLTQMVKIYYEKTGDDQLFDRALPTLDKELEFWTKNTSIEVNYNGRAYVLNHYNVENNAPRPESYYEDYNTVNNGTSFTEQEKDSLYADLATGAETGWDYSSRWLKDPLSSSSLHSLNTRAIVPVDLNSLLYANEVTMGAFYKLRGDRRGVDGHDDYSKSFLYNQLAESRSKAMEDVLWDDAASSFFDFNLTSGQRSSEFSLSNYYPFWVGPLPSTVVSDSNRLTSVFEKINTLLDTYPGILPTTLLESGQQWDFPNGWPPLQFILVKALLESDKLFKLNHPYRHRARRDEALYDGGFYDMAKNLSSRVIGSSFCGWVQTGGSIPDILPKQVNTDDTGHMFEKYNVTAIGLPGSSGEYVVQLGFGWTNGVVLWTLNEFGAVLDVPNCIILK